MQGNSTMNLKQLNTPKERINDKTPDQKKKKKLLLVLSDCQGKGKRRKFEIYSFILCLSLSGEDIGPTNYFLERPSYKIRSGNFYWKIHHGRL